MPDKANQIPNLEQDHALLISAVRKAGDIARKYFHSDFEKWDKKAGDPVTEADIAIDRFLHDELTQARPNFGWLSEESKDDQSRLNCDRVWLVDPIDGTRAFIKRRPHFTISVALATEGKPIAGAIYNPITEEFYEAVKGSGARCNGQPIRTSRQRELPGCRMLGDPDLFRHPAWRKPWPEMTIETRNSIAYRMALVAAGKWDACLTLSGKSDWDIAAGDIIVREAGGIVTTHTGEPLRYNRPETRLPSVIAAGPPLHREILARVHHMKLPASSH
ncbi:MAG: 3'(2'),5'-bisphosphate nucleotidase CysQ [Alphaproteobacteria bacterium]|nr:MAG: 3'(2'),5'-bisphosphate nucleotidase CysQ [Alphaproteobacteria bacterium]